MTLFDNGVVPRRLSLLDFKRMLRIFFENLLESSSMAVLVSGFSYSLNEMFL